MTTYHILNWGDNMTTYHISQSIDGLKRLISNGRRITWIMIDGKTATTLELLAAIEDAESKGYDVIPPCKNIDSKGHCLGHNDKDVSLNNLLDWIKK